MSDNGLASREDVLQPAKRRFKTIELPNGVRVRIRNLTERERSEYDASLLNKRGEWKNDNVRRLFAITLVDCDGNLLLRPGDINALGDLDSVVTTVLGEEIKRHCGFGAGDIEELVKNSQDLTDDALRSG